MVNSEVKELLLGLYIMVKITLELICMLIELIIELIFNNFYTFMSLYLFEY